MVRIAVDVMGGDHAPLEIIKGAVAATRERDVLEVCLVGKEGVIRKILENEEYASEQVKIVAADDIITTDDEPSLAARQKKASSLVVAINLVKNGEADAALSAGSTGALMVGAIFSLGRVKEVQRPALLTVFPTPKGKGVVVLDVGANMDAKPEHLQQYAKIGVVYASEILGYPNPKCALLNVGEERTKGNNQTRKAYPLLEANVDGFIGNIEARDVFAGESDVIVCDGFAGNILLKTTEGVSKGIFATLREEFSRSLLTRSASALLLPALRRIRSKLDESEYGGAPLLGVNGICIKCHGSSKAKAIKQALLNQAYPMVVSQTNKKIIDALS
ncbi:MAG: phosphate acyltransferase PlsX [Firmicutes bacterium]|nr:phosphate acyltransferase PlsX [Bacillota bacterium]